MGKFDDILKKATADCIDPDEALCLFEESENYEKAQDLFRVAAKVRDRELGTVFKWSGGVASVLPCKLRPLCCYCPYWVKKTEPLAMAEILKAVNYIEEIGINNFHLSGGTDLKSDGAELVEIVKNIRAESGSEITVNVGAAISPENVLELKALGVTRIGSVFETINPDLFARLKPGDSLEAKKKLAKTIDAAGIGLGTGLLAGLGTDQSRFKDYVDFMFYIKQFGNLKRVYISRFNPVKGTPLEDHPRCSTLEGARIMAVMRLVLRNVEIGPAAGWSYDDIPVWVAAGGGNSVGGVHVTRTPGYTNNWYLHSAVNYSEKMEYRNIIPVATKILNEMEIQMQF